MAIIAAAGSRKTQCIVEAALADPSRRVLITTYTNENLRQIVGRLSAGTGIVPPHVTVMTWFSFLLNECTKPYQRAILGEPNLVRGLDFVGSRARFTPLATPVPYFLDSVGNAYRDGVSDLACRIDKATGGMMIERLGDMYDHLYLDELQDVVGYDLDLLDLLMRSRIGLTMVGDPRQFTLETNRSPRNKKYEGEGVVDWLNQRSDVCVVESRVESYRCNQDICNFADALFPHLPTTVSMNDAITGHDGMFAIKPAEVQAYVTQYNPVVLRPQKNTDTLRLEAMNIGVSKGSTFDRILIFPTNPMIKYYRTRDPEQAGAKARLYVAVTRARHSATFVIP